jgi:hypothetical protein
MAGELQKSPSGLLELFELRTQGRAPTVFSDSVGVTIDALNFYGADRIFTADTAGAAGAISQTLTVPTTFPRIFLGFSAQLTLGAAPGTWATIRLGIRAPGGGSALFLLAQTTISGAPPLVAGEFYEAVGMMPAPTLLPAGCAIVARSSGDAGGADHVLTVKTLSYALSPTPP